MNLGELIFSLAFDVKGEANAKKFNKTLDNIEKKAEAVGKKLATAGKIAGTAFATGFVALGKSVLTTSGSFEKYLATLETIEGSADKAKSSFEWISKFAVKTPFEMDELTRSFVKLKAYGIDPTNGTMETLGNTASAMGTSIMQAVEMFADASNGEMERLKEYGVTSKTAGDNITFYWDKNGKRLSKTVKKNSEEIREFLLDNLGSRFNGAMLRQSKTWEGMLSNLGDSWTMFQYRIGQGGFFDAVKGKLAGLLDQIGRWQDDGTLDKWSQRLSNAFTTVVDVVAKFATQFGAHWDYLSSLSGEAAERIAPFMSAIKALGLMLAARLFPITFFLGMAALAIDDFLTYMEGGESVIGDFVNALAEFLGAEPDKVAAALGKIAEGALLFAAGAAGIALFASSIRKLAGALGLLKSLRWAAPMLASMAGVKWATAATGAAGAAVAVGGLASRGGSTRAVAKGAAGALAVSNLVKIADKLGFILGRLASIGIFVHSINNKFAEIDTKGVQKTLSDAAERSKSWDDAILNTIGTPRTWLGLGQPQLENQFKKSSTGGPARYRSASTEHSAAPDIERALTAARRAGMVAGMQADRAPAAPRDTRRPDQLGIGATIGDRIVAAVQVVAGKLDASRFALNADADGNISARPNQAGGVNVLQEAMAKLAANANNIESAMARMQPEAAAQAVTKDMRQSHDNRSFPVSVSAPVSVHVTNATSAPDRVGNAISRGITSGANAGSQKARIAGTPSTSFPARSSAQ